MAHRYRFRYERPQRRRRSVRRGSPRRRWRRRPRVAESAATEPVETTGGGGGGGGGRLGLRRVLSPPGSPYWGRMRGGGRLESEGEAAACMRVSREGLRAIECCTAYYATRAATVARIAG